MHKVLVVDDEKALRFALRRALGRLYDVAEAEDGEQALTLVERDRPALVLLDLQMPGLSGLDVLERLAATAAPPPVIMLTAHGSERVAVKAMQRGAYDYLAKPYDIDELRLACERAIAARALADENVELKQALRASAGAGELLGESDALRAVRALVERLAPLDATVLVQGESGTGKELVARALHALSSRAKGPFVAVNCAALPEALVESELFGHEKGAFTGALTDRRGRFEAANGGTLFLDEIGEAPLALQAKLLRVLETRKVERVGGHEPIEVDVRLVTATNRDLKDRVRQGAFREDLYYRLKVIDVDLPPLRARAGDALVLARHFLQLAATRHGLPRRALSEAAAAALARYSFPGNVRELANLCEKAAILARGPLVKMQDLPREVLEQAGDLAGLADDRAAAGASDAPLALDTSAREGDEAADDAAEQADLGGDPSPAALGADAAAAEAALGDLLSGQELGFAEAKRRARARFEEALLQRSLARHRGNVSRTARALGLHRQSLQAKLKEHGIDAQAFRA